MLPIKIDMPTILLFLFFGNLIIAGMLAVYSSSSIIVSANRRYFNGEDLAKRGVDFTGITRLYP